MNGTQAMTSDEPNSVLNTRYTSRNRPLTGTSAMCPMPALCIRQ